MTKNTTPAPAPLIVTLDGPAGVGKSTLAMQVAQALGIGYLDTGAMFRTIALKTLGQPIDMDDNGDKLLTAVGPLDFTLRTTPEGNELLCNNLPITEAIRNESVAVQAANIAVFPAIRDFLKHCQQAIGKSTALVAEGRDMGTVVFPEARYKFFLEANVEVRAKRRYDQLLLMKQEANIEEIIEQIRLRDYQDRNRPVAPLIPAKDAITIDTSYLTIEEVLAAILQHCGNDN